MSVHSPGGPALLDTVTGSAPELIFAKDRAGRMPRAKEATRAVIGRTLTEILGQTIVEFADDSPDARTVMANDQRVMSLAVTEHMQEIAPAGRAFQVTKSPLRHDHGIVVGMVGVGVDMTERSVAAVLASTDVQARLIGPMLFSGVSV